MLDLFGMNDDWLPTGPGVLPPYGCHIHTISDALVLSSAGIIGLRTGEVIEDTLDHTDPALDGYERQNGSEEGGVLLRSPTVTLRGRYLSLLLGNHANHFHWLLMNFARLAILQSVDFERLDGILVPAGLTPTQEEALHLAGLTQHAPLRPVERGESLQIETLVLPWNVASSYGVNPDAVAYLRSLVPPRPPQKRPRAKRRIYIDRRNAPLRRLFNEEEIIDTLRREGVEPATMEGLSLADQARLLKTPNWSSVRTGLA